MDDIFLSIYEQVYMHHLWSPKIYLLVPNWYTSQFVNLFRIVNFRF